MVDLSQFASLADMTAYYISEERCRDAIIERRWGSGDEQDVICPYCGGHHCRRRKGGKLRCPQCKRNFSCLVRTIFHNTKLPLRKWFIAIYHMSTNKKGISSCHLAHEIGVTQKSAFYMLKKIRSLYAQKPDKKMSGTVECDEVYIGGKEKWKHLAKRTRKTQGRSTQTKTPVFGMIERSYIVNKKGEKESKSYVRAMVVNDTSGATLKPIISRYVAKESTIYTDEYRPYLSLPKLGYTHGVCLHKQGKYVCNDDVHTNNIECFWSQLRRMITGCYHNVSKAYLQTYVDEACFRWNTRKMSDSACFAHMLEAAVRRG